MMTELPDPRLFDTPPEDDFDRLTELAALLTDTPVALLSLVDETRQFFKSAVGLGEPWASKRETPLSHSFCKIVVESGQPLVVEDARKHPVLRHNLAIRDLGVISYLGEPVRTPSGRLIGSFCAIDSKVRDWTARERRIVATLARSVENAIALRAATDAQRDALADLMRINKALAMQSAELSEARAIAERALAQQTRFLAGLSHELKTPLNGVLGGVTLLETAQDDAARARCGRMIRASAKALGGCVEDLIAYCRMGAGIDKVAIETFDPRAAVAAAVDAARALASEKGLRLESRIDPDAPDAWVSDGRRVEQILVNLLGNAAKYTVAGVIGVALTAEDDGLAFRVFDTGRGVPEPHRDRIFEPFNRGDPETARSATGTGLGLSIARETAQRIGGSLSLESSRKGAGSIFLLRLPRAEARPAESAALRRA
jgi:signal transduction histidine kinase